MTEDLTLTIALNHDALTVTVTTPAGDAVAAASSAYDSLTPAPARIEQRPDDWWRALTTAIDALRPRTDLAAVSTVTLTGDLRAVVLLDSERQPIRHAILAGDARATEGAPSVIRWLRAHEPIAYKRIRCLTTPRGYLRLLLTGRLALDPEDAASTALLDPATRQWSLTLCDAHEINPDILPRIVEREPLPLIGAVSATLALNAVVV